MVVTDHSNMGVTARQTNTSSEDHVAQSQPLKEVVEDLSLDHMNCGHPFTISCRPTLISYQRGTFMNLFFRSSSTKSKAHNYYFYINLFYSAILVVHKSSYLAQNCSLNYFLDFGYFHAALSMLF